MTRRHTVKFSKRLPGTPLRIEEHTGTASVTDGQGVPGAGGGHPRVIS